MTKDDIRRAIKAAQNRLAERFEITQEGIIRELVEIGEEARRDKVYSSAIKARELIGRHIGMWPNKAEVTGPNGGPIPVMAATVVLPVEDMAPQQREVLRSLLLQAKAKEREMSQASVEATGGREGAWRQNVEFRSFRSAYCERRTPAT
jgi:hypothetical protein